MLLELAACRIEHALAGLDVRRIGYATGPLLKEGRKEEGLVHLGRSLDDLTCRICIHVALHSSTVGRSTQIGQPLDLSTYIIHLLEWAGLAWNAWRSAKAEAPAPAPDVVTG
jgi:hypothetical protein